MNAGPKLRRAVLNTVVDALQNAQTVGMRVAVEGGVLLVGEFAVSLDDMGRVTVTKQEAIDGKAD